MNLALEGVGQNSSFVLLVAEPRVPSPGPGLSRSAPQLCEMMVLVTACSL